MAKSPTVPARPPCRLYLITPPVIPDLDAFANLLGQALDAGDVAPTRLVFEVDAAGKVTSWRVGLSPQVEYVEGCS